MKRNLYAYWVCAEAKSPAEITKLNEAMDDAKLLVPDGPLTCYIGNRGCRLMAEVEDGSVEQDADIHEAIAKIVANIPGLTVTLTEEDTEDTVNYTETRWEGGKEVWSGCRRTVEPGKYDAPTVLAIVQHLKDKGLDDVANEVVVEFAEVN